MSVSDNKKLLEWIDKNNWFSEDINIWVIEQTKLKQAIINGEFEPDLFWDLLYKRAELTRQKIKATGVSVDEVKRGKTK